MKRQVTFCVLVGLALLLFTACGSSGGTTGSNQVQVNETDFKIDASTTTFTPGMSYHFVVVNNGHTTHEFMIMPSSMSMGGMPMGNMDKIALAKVENIAPGQSVTLDYTFSSSTAGSHPLLACYYPGHYEAGMKLSVNVSK